MANAKISDLPPVTAIAGADLAVVVQGGVTSQTAINDIFTDRTLVDPLLGTPVSGDLTNCTDLPIAGIAGLGTGVDTALAVNTGTAGAMVLFDGALGTPASGDLSNCTDLPIAGIDGLGTGVDTALAVNVGASGSVQLFITATAAALVDEANAINTTGKFAGKQVWDSTNNVPLWAAGSGVNDVWIDGTGTTVITPAP
jgi:hypothetical protein